MSKPLAYYTSLSSSQILSEFDREIDVQSHGKFYVWLEKSFPDFEEMRQSFSNSCDEYMVSDHGFSADSAWRYSRAIFFKWMIDKVPEFRRIKGLDETKDFINSFIK